MEIQPNTLLVHLGVIVSALAAASTAHAQACPPATTWSPQHQLCVASPAAHPQPYGAQPYGAQAPYAAQAYTQETYVSRPLWGLFIAGLATFGGIYLLTVGLTAGLDTDNDDGWLYVPLVGPWLEAALGGDPDSWTALWVPSGILQLAGVVMAILGLAIQQRAPARADNGRLGAQTASLLVLPFVSSDAGSAGLFLTGSL